MLKTYASAVSLAALSVAVFNANPAQAQETAVPTIVVQEQSDPVSSGYVFGRGGDSGTSIVGRDAVERRKAGSGDATQLLKLMPGVQFSREAGDLDPEAIQDLRPADISISGGNIYENMITLDGVGVNSRLDVSADNPNHFEEGNAAGSAQTVWVDVDLIDSITLRDSNISAEFGQFTGGVVQMTTRSPSHQFGLSTYYGRTSPDLAQFRMADSVKLELDGDEPDAPVYDKERFSFIVDLPAGERLRTLLSYARNEASVTKDRGSSWRQYGPYGQSSLKETWLLKGEYDLADDLLLTGQINYSPYETEFAHQNGYDNLTVLSGGGLTTTLGLQGRRDAAEWQLDLSYVRSDTDRTSENPGTLAVSTVGTGIDWCSSSTCSVGGPGNLVQRQEDVILKGSWDQPLTDGDLRLGFEISHITGRKAQPYDRSYRHGANAAAEVGATIVCADPAENAAQTCVDGRYALGQFNETLAYDTERAFEAYGLWAEYAFDWGGFDIRAGLRYDHETFLGNHDFAPRLSVSRQLPWEGHYVTVGANRYYGRSFLGYALREDYPGTVIWRRTPTMVNGEKVFSNNWKIYSHTQAARYSNADLSTPYSDELTLAFNGPVPYLGGDYRVRGVIRDGQDQFSSSRASREQYDQLTGETALQNVYQVTNDGERDYRGLSVEYIRRLGQHHALTLNAIWSRTKSTNISYFDISEDVEFDNVLVLYNGMIVPRLEAIADNQIGDFAAPWTVNADLSSQWFDGRLRTSVNARWMDGFSRVEDTQVNQTVDGTRYDVFGVVDYNASLDVNLSLTAEVARTRYGTAELDVRINNLFNSVLNQNSTSTSNPWQLGRNAWIGVRVRY